MTGEDPQGNDIPFVKFNRPPEMLMPKASTSEDVWAEYEVINTGTAPTTAQDEVWCSAILQHTVVHQTHVGLDNPPVDPDGGTRSGDVRIPGGNSVAGQWGLDFAVTNALGDIVDEATVSFEVVGADDGNGEGGDDENGDGGGDD